MNTPQLSYKIPKENIVAMKYEYNNDRKINELTLYLEHGHTVVLSGAETFKIYDSYKKDNKNLLNYEI